MRLGSGMRALCDGPTLLSALEVVWAAAPRAGGTEPIDVHLRAEGSAVNLALGDEVDPKEVTVPAAVRHQGSAVAPARDLLDLLRAVTAQDVGLISQGAGLRLELRAEGRTYMLPHVPPSQPIAMTSSAPMKNARRPIQPASLPPKLPPVEPGPADPEKTKVESARPTLSASESKATFEKGRNRRSALLGLFGAASASRSRFAHWRPTGIGGVRGIVILSLLLLLVGLLPLPYAIGALSLIGAAAAAAVIPLVHALGPPRRSLLGLGVAIGLAYLVLFPVRALVVLFDLDPFENVRVDTAAPEDVRRALEVAAVGILAGSLAYVAPIGAWLGERLPLPRAGLAEKPGVLLPLGLFAAGFVAQVVILAGQHLEEVDRVLASRSSGLVSGASVLLLLGLGLLTRRAASTHDPVARRALAVAIGLGLLASLGGQFKEVAILTIGMPLLVWLLTTEVQVRRSRLAIAAALLVAMFAAVTVWRYASDRIDTADPVAVALVFPNQVVEYSWSSGGKRPFRPWSPLLETSSLVSRRLYGYDSLTLATRYTPSVVPHQDGATLGNLAAGLVPRILWPSKPSIGIGYWFAQSYWGTPPGVLEVPQSPTHIGELWIDFGWAGVVIGMTILGIWYRFVYAALRPRASGTGAIVYAIVFLTVLPVDRDLPLVYVTLVQRLVIVALLLSAAALVTRAFEGRRA